MRRLLIFLLIVGVAYAGLRSKRDLDDFAVYRTAAARASASADLYREDDGHYQYKYLPLFAFAMIPFAWLPIEIASAVWFLLTAWMVWLFIGLSARLVPDRRLAMRRLLWLSAFLTAKFWLLELIHGQTNVLLGLVALAAISAAARGRPALAGACAGIAVFVKPYALILLPWLIVSGGVPAVGAFAATVIAGLFAPALVLGWSGNLSALREWALGVSATTAPNLLVKENISFASFWAKHLGIGPVAAAWASVCSGMIAATALLALWRRRTVAAPDYLDAAVLLLMVPLISPQGWDYVLLLGVPAVMLLVDRFAVTPAAWRIVIVAGIVLTNFLVFDVFGRTLYLWLTGAGAATLAAVALVAATLRLRVRALA